MAQSLARVLTHLVFSTKHRIAFLTPALQSELYPYLANVLSGLDCPTLQIGGTEDHVHLFFGLSRTRAIASVVETVKTSSSKWIKSKGSDFSSFYWQAGYACFSVSQSRADAVCAYIRNQSEHHRRMTFQEEYRNFLIQYNIPHDERFIWD